MAGAPETADAAGAVQATATSAGEPMLRLAPAAIWSWRIVGLSRAVAAAFAGAVLAGWSYHDPGISAAFAAVLLAAGVALAMGIARARYRAWGYSIRDDALVLRRGILWQATSVVPLSRIQHVDTRRGPLDRGLGLARVVVYTAGVTGGALELPGLERETAEALRERLAALSEADDAV